MVGTGCYKSEILKDEAAAASIERRVVPHGSWM